MGPRQTAVNTLSHSTGSRASSVTNGLCEPSSHEISGTCEMDEQPLGEIPSLPPEVTDICINGIGTILCDLGLMRTSFLGMNGAMPSKYDENTRARAARLVREHASDYGSEWTALKAISGRLGMTAEMGA
jgi:hypothetical protein